MRAIGIRSIVNSDITSTQSVINIYAGRSLGGNGKILEWERHGSFSCIGIAREPFCSTTVALYSRRAILHLVTDVSSVDIREEMAEKPRNIRLSGDRPLTARSGLATLARGTARKWLVRRGSSWLVRRFVAVHALRAAGLLTLLEASCYRSSGKVPGLPS